MEAQRVSIVSLGEVQAELNDHEKVREALALIDKMGRERVLVIKHNEMALDYNEKYLQIQAMLKALDATRADIVGPYRKLTEAINAFFKNLGERLKQRQLEFNNALVVWRRKEEEKARKEQERIRRQQEKLMEAQRKAEREAEGRGEGPPPVAPMPKFITPKPDKVKRTASGATHTWIDYEIEVVDMKALARAVADGVIPDKVLDIRQAEMKGLARAGIKIPGVKVTEVTKLKASIR